MGKIQYAHPDNQLIYTPSYTVGTVDTSFPASRLTDIEHPRRTTRTTNTTAPTIECDFTSATTIAALWIANVNYQKLVLKGNSVNNDWANAPWEQLANVSLADEDSGHRQLIIIPTSTFNYRYLQLECSGLDSGETYYETGALGSWSSLTELTENFEFPYDKTSGRPLELVDLPSGGHEPSRPGALTVKLALTGKFQRAAAYYSRLKSLLRIQPNQPFLFFENVHTNSNLLDWSEAFDEAVWQKNGSGGVTPPAVTADQYTNPDSGETNADKIVFSDPTGGGASIFQTDLPYTLLANQTVTFSVWLKKVSGSGTTIRIKVRDEASTSETVEVRALTSSWVRHSTTHAFGAITTDVRVALAQDNGDTAIDIAAWGAQLEIGSAASTYYPIPDQALTKAYLCYPSASVTISRDTAKTDSIRGLTFSTIW